MSCISWCCLWCWKHYDRLTLETAATLNGPLSGVGVDLENTQFFTVRTKLPSTSSTGNASAELYWSLLQFIMRWPLYEKISFLPNIFLQETLNWSRLWRRFGLLMFHLDLTGVKRSEDGWLFAAVLSWQSAESVLWQNSSRTYTGVELHAAVTAKSRALQGLHISTDNKWLRSKLWLPAEHHTKTNGAGGRLKVKEMLALEVGGKHNNITGKDSNTFGTQVIL